MKTTQHEQRPQYARAAAACQRFGVSRSTLWQWAKRPDFPKPLRIGRKTVLYDVEAVDAFIRLLSESA